MTAIGEATDKVDVPKDSEMSGDYEDENRANWSSRWVFWLAAIGSAVGLGNLWRFPWQCATWGGGAFIFAYVLCLITIGMPIMTQELTLGQKHRSGDIEAFGKMNWRLRGIGLASVCGTFGIVTYYMVIIGLSLVLFFDSFRKTLPYGEDNPTYAYDNVWFLADSIEDSKGIIGGRLFVCTTLAWIITFLCIQKGVKTASWAVKITMPLPILLLIILLFKGFTLEGAGIGIKERYWNFTDWSRLSEVELWNAAIGQCFFSLSVCMGVMTAYASYNPPNQNIATDEKVISVSDLMVSLMSGFVVYSVLGHLASKETEQCEVERVFGSASFGLAFVTYPVAIESFKGAQFFGIAFFLTLFLLGIDSAFSMVEAISTVIEDSDFNKYKLGGMSRIKISGALCFVGAFISALYCWDTGLYWLDIVDRYINNYGMVLIGIAETCACGWFYRTDVQTTKVGYKSVNIYRYAYFLSLFLLVLFGYSLGTPVCDIIETDPNDPCFNFEELTPIGRCETQKGRCEFIEDVDRILPDSKPGTCKFNFSGGLGSASWGVGFGIGFITWISGLIAAYIHRENKELSLGASLWYIAGWQNVEILREFINTITDRNWPDKQETFKGECRASYHHGLIGFWWGFFIKYFIPTILVLNLVGVMRDESWNPYEGYPWKCLIIGVFIFSAMIICMFVIAIKPELMTQSDDTDVNKDGYVDPLLDKQKDDAQLQDTTDNDTQKPSNDVEAEPNTNDETAAFKE